MPLNIIGNIVGNYYAEDTSWIINYPEYPGAAVTTSNVSFASSVDPALTALKAKVIYPTGKVNLPMMIVTPGYHDSYTSIDPGPATNQTRWAQKGYIVVFFDPRQSGTSSGTFDDGGRATHDIYDCIQYVQANFATQLGTASNRIGILGYSGGGGHAMLMACKYPDLFTTATSFFGISDWGSDPTFGWYQQQPTRQSALTTAIGGTPATKPDEYKARHSQSAIAQNFQGYLSLFHDTGDASVGVDHSQRVVSSYITAGRGDYYYNETNPSSPKRWLHGYPSVSNDLPAAEQFFMDNIKKKPIVTAPTSGTLKIIGSVTTKRFRVHLNDGDLNNAERSRHATLIYDTVANTYQITNNSATNYLVACVTDLSTGNVDTQVILSGQTGTLVPVSAQISGVTIANWFEPSLTRVIKNGSNRTTVMCDKVGGFQKQGYAFNIGGDLGGEPVYNASGLNSLPTITFTASYLQGPLIRSIKGKSRFSIFAVGTGTGIDQGISSSQHTQTEGLLGGNYFTNISNGAGAYGYYAGTAVFKVRTKIYDGTLTGNTNRLKAREDKVAQTLNYDGLTIPATSENNDTSVAKMGRVSYTATNLNGDMAICLIVEDVAVDNTQAGAIEDFLKAKYAI